jgi:hypothetical protein
MNITIKFKAIANMFPCLFPQAAFSIRDNTCRAWLVDGLESQHLLQ